MRVIAIFISLLAVSVPAAATTMVPKERVCPIGGEKYKSFEIASTSYFGIRLDLQRTGVGAFLPYVECPNGFIVYKDESEFKTDEIAKLTPVVSSPEYQVARTNEMPAMRVVMLRRALGDDDATLRNWLFKAALEAEQNQQKELRLKYLAMAVNAYSDYLLGHSKHDSNWWFSAVRRADLLRQLSRFDEAIAVVKDIRAVNDSDDQNVPFFLKVAAQIEKQAAVQNAQPTAFEDQSP
jgi:hypothetical protein